MAFLANNSGYISIDGEDFSDICKEWEISSEAEVYDTTAGFSKTHRDRESGIKDAKLSVMLAYEVGAADVDVTHFTPGLKVAVEAGAEGNVSGKPRHSQNFVVKSVNGPKRTSEGGLALFSISLEGAGVPTADMYAGATFT